MSVRVDGQVPRRVSHHYLQTYRHSRQQVWPQLCPVAEQDWVPGWRPLAVYSACGVIEKDCVFTMPGEQGDVVWLVSEYEASAFHLIMYKITPDVTVAKIEIQLNQDGEACTADIRYTHTSLSDLGDQFLQQFTADYFERFMLEWQHHLDDYLTHKSVNTHTSTLKQ